jgi:peptidoglycan L-alanyl-D-glutamate endopeptidase CwlK
MAEILALDSPPISIRVTEGLRSWDKQALLFAQGRTSPGKVVTKALPGYSYHQFGLAVDLVPIEADLGLLDWNPLHPVWQRLIQCGVAQGLTAGAEFRSFPDFPHFQLTGRLPASPDDEVRQIFLQAGIQGVWQESGLM